MLNLTSLLATSFHNFSIYLIISLTFNVVIQPFLVMFHCRVTIAINLCMVLVKQTTGNSLESIFA